MRIRINGNTLSPNLDRLPERVNAGIALGMQYGEDRARQYARINAPWTDRTGNARSGLDALYESDGGSHILTLFHRMPYGIWLEVAFSGRFGIIMKTLRAILPELRNAITAAVKRSLEVNR